MVRTETSGRYATVISPAGVLHQWRAVWAAPRGEGGMATTGAGGPRAAEGADRGGTRKDGGRDVANPGSEFRAGDFGESSLLVCRPTGNDTISGRKRVSRD
jgi:hypothetical protein